MKIYVCVPGKFLPLAGKISSGFREKLRKFYGRLKDSDIEILEGRPNFADVYIMGDSSHPPEKIMSVIEEFLPETLSRIERLDTSAVNIKLNYSRINPNFRPEPYRKKTAITEKNQKSSLNDDLKEFDYESLSKNYKAESPRFSFSRVILPESVMTKIKEALAVIQAESIVFDEWGLRKIMPFASCAMTFYGPPGTGKSMAAEAVAEHLGKKIIRATYADITSKYKGQGPKMAKALFLSAKNQDAVLFIDEAEAFLAKRSASSEDSAEASNAMKSQLLILLEEFNGVVIFATNIPKINDRAFNARLIGVKFPLPDKDSRAAIWEQHIRGEGIRIPLSDDVNVSELAEKYEFCGRDIKKAVRDACVTAAINGKTSVSQGDFDRACMKVKTENEDLDEAEDYSGSKPATFQLSERMTKVLQKKIAEAESV